MLKQHRWNEGDEHAELYEEMEGVTCTECGEHPEEVYEDGDWYCECGGHGIWKQTE